MLRLAAFIHCPWPAWSAWMCCLCLALFGASPSAHAGGMSVLPTRIDFSAGRQVASVLLTNTSGQTMTVETQVLVWPDEASGQLASDIVVNPPVVTLGPDERVRVRIGLVRQTPAAVERSYRLYFTELPTPAALMGVDIGVRLRIGMPIFVAPQRADSRALQWSLREAATGWSLVAHNPGNLHTRISEVRLGDDPQALGLTSHYVLAGRELVVALPRPPAAATPARVRWQEAGDERQAVLPPAP